MLPFSVILHIVDTADKMNSNTNYLDSSFVPIVYRSLMFAVCTLYILALCQQQQLMGTALV